MAAIFNQGILIPEGVIAYPDSENRNNYFYIPIKCECLLDNNIQQFKLTYWGIGKQFLQKQENGKIANTVGAIFTGKVTPDISPQQRHQLIKQIIKTFGVEKPQLTPLPLTNIKIQPFIGEQVWSIGKDADILFPETWQIGTNFHFLIGTGNQSFTKHVGYQKRGIKLTSHPPIGINIVGECEFKPEAFSAEIEADLSKVWSYVRQRVSDKIAWEWLDLKFTEYQKLIQDMLREKVIKLTVKPGNINLQKSNWLALEIGRKIFAAVNNQGISETGYFRFEPNPTTQTYSKLEDGTFWLGKTAINLSYGAQAIPSSPAVYYKSDIDYSESLTATIPIALLFNIQCNADSAEFFQDLGNVSESCITDEKIQQLQQRMIPEIFKQTQFFNRLYNRLIAKEITQQQYEQAWFIIN
ncbi:hypothetical protein [Fortiea contorta]|uniref:hypothetical protein n=1 Tax=Fortiea contorta TaxID=1892405 RepID=UPI00034766E6|nr:hypothetical protein [Fortiea contorta]